MPLFEYECPQCKKRSEVFRRSGEFDAVPCYQCNTDMVKLFSGIGGYHIKGNNSASHRPKNAGCFKRSPK